MSLSPRPERLTRMVGAGPLRGQPHRAGERVRGLDRRDDPLGAAEQRHRVHRLGVGHRAVGRRARSRRGTRAPGRRPGSRGRPRSSATRWSGRPRPAARRCGHRAGRPTSPAQIVAACRAVSTPSPPASKPTSSTSASSRNAVNSPIALEPPPTQATTASGRAPVELEALRPGLVADAAAEVAHHRRERVRPGDGAEEVGRVVDAGHPVADRLVDRVLEGARAGGHRDHLGAEQPHPGDVERLALGVDLAHVDGAVEAEERRRGGGGDAVLAGAGLGDHPGLAHAPGQQRLAEHVVDLVRAGVVEVLALEQDPGAGLLAEPVAS